MSEDEARDARRYRAIRRWYAEAATLSEERDTVCAKLEFHQDIFRREPVDPEAVAPLAAENFDEMVDSWMKEDAYVHQPLGKN